MMILLSECPSPYQYMRVVNRAVHSMDSEKDVSLSVKHTEDTGDRRPLACTKSATHFSVLELGPE
jgi:hypothetical protein